jgi:hypothetical protein
MNEQHHDFDVCVVGGGMAGMCAALAAARHGAKTAIVHDRPVFGGNASSEIRMWICGAHDVKETGLLEELLLENAYRNPTGNYSVWDSALYGKIACQPHLTHFLNCSCTGCKTDSRGDEQRITTIRCWQLTSQTWHNIGAKLFIDCSGDSILAEPSGAAFRTGREARTEFDEDIEPAQSDAKTMGNSLLIQLRRTEEPHPFTPPRWAYRFESPEDLPHRIRGVQGHNFWWIELGGLQDTIRDAEAIRDELMKTAWGVWDYIKNRAPEKDQAEHWALEWLGSLPGKRENRRYEGPHILTQNDVRDGGRFDDIIAYGGWSMDDHHPAGLLYPGKPTIFHPAPSPYGIPYRCLYSRNVDNLLFAGRNISVTHAALSSTRVMATCAVIGQAAGTAAALAVQHGVAPAGLYPNRIAELQQRLMEDDAYLPGLARGIDDLTTTASCDTPQLNNGHDRPLGEQANAWIGGVGDAATLTWPEPVDIAAVRLVFDSNLSHDKRMPCSYPLKGNRQSMPTTLVRGYRIEAADEAGQWQAVCRETDNYQRLAVTPVQRRAQGLRLVVETTWGDEQVKLFGFEALARDPKRLPAPPVGKPWREVVAAIDPADLAPPDSGLEDAARRKSHGATRSSTWLADSSISFCSSAVSLNSTTFSTPPAPSIAGTPTNRPFLPNSPSQVGGGGDDALLVLDDRLDHLDGAAGRGVVGAGAHELDDLAAADLGALDAGGDLAPR